MNDWKIRQREDLCSACRREFEVGEAHFSVLYLAAAGFEREDRCAACFDARGPRDGAEELVWWRTRRRPSRRVLQVDFEAVEALFTALDGRAEPRLVELRYLLALLLLRKRRLKLSGLAQEAGREVLVVRRPRRDERILVASCELTPERAAELRAELARVFDGVPLDDLLAAPPPDAAGLSPVLSPLSSADGGSGEPVEGGPADGGDGRAEDGSRSAR